MITGKEVITHAQEEEEGKEYKPVQDREDERQSVQDETRQEETVQGVIFWGSFFLLGPGLVGLLASQLALYFAWPLENTGIGELVEMLLCFGGVWLALLLYVGWVEKRRPASIGLTPIPRKIGEAYPGSYAILVLLIIAGLIDWSAAWSLVARFIQAGAEEAVCRGWILSRITEQQGVQMGVIANSLVFVVFHALNPGFNVLAIISLTLFSVLMSLLAIRFKHIWWCIIIHAFWNWSVSLIF